MYLTLSIDKVVELHFISHSASGPIIRDILQSCLRKHSCEITESVVSEMVTELCDANPFTIALSSGGPLSSAYKRRAYFKEHFAVVGPVEYVLRREEEKLPVSLFDDIYYKTKDFFSEEDPVIAIIIYVDDSGHIKEGKKKVTAVYWVNTQYTAVTFFSLPSSGTLMFLHFSDLCEPPTS